MSLIYIYVSHYKKLFPRKICNTHSNACRAQPQVIVYDLPGRLRFILTRWPYFQFRMMPDTHNGTQAKIFKIYGISDIFSPSITLSERVNNNISTLLEAFPSSLDFMEARSFSNARESLQTNVLLNDTRCRLLLHRCCWRFSLQGWWISESGGMLDHCQSEALRLPKCAISSLRSSNTPRRGSIFWSI